VNKYTLWYPIFRGETVTVVSADKTSLVVKKDNGCVRSFSSAVAPANLSHGDTLMMGRNGKFAFVDNHPLPVGQPEEATASNGSLTRVTQTPTPQKVASVVKKKRHTSREIPDSVPFESVSR